MKGYIQRESDKALKDSGNSLGPNLTQEKLHQEVLQKPSRNNSDTSGILVIQSSGSQLYWAWESPARLPAPKKLEFLCIF